MPLPRREEILLRISNAINKELKAYNPEIASRPQVIAANKVDMIFDDGSGNDPVANLKKEFEPQG